MPLTVQTPEGQAARKVQTDAAAAGTNPISGITLAAALTYLQNNVTDLATAKVYLAHLTKVVFQHQADIALLKKEIQQK